ncbi:MAG TPA: folylpolyglutamate synthase/dihydrofolate synthase family protein [Verrucomicrobiae bacterium]|nr:folylpolyglutamate synthase/dihydrofolate synthase family protein [Verrucomicrobiae bacterium]
MNYTEAIQFLYKLRLFGTKLGLENSFALAELCGAPHRSLRFIHVAGTNGKGSVCALLENIYRRSGLRTGLFTSPHLVSFTERMQVDRRCIGEEDVTRLVGALSERLGGADVEQWELRPTFFEFVTVMALLYFVEQRCDLVIWETGLGGRLDSTNIVTPLASVITNIDRDHEQWLGHTLREIATEKAGIIKPGLPIITATESGEALAVIAETAQNLSSPLTVVKLCDYEKRISSYTLSLLGEHQRTNAALALATVEALGGTLTVYEQAIASGMATTFWPGRLQQLAVGDSHLLLDGAHNPAGAKSLTQALSSYFPGREVTLVLGLFKDKAWQEMCEILVPRAARVFLVPLQSERSADQADVQDYCARRWPEVKIVAASSAGAAIAEALVFPFVVIAGSLHLIGEAMEHLRIVPSLRSERALNEWNAAAESLGNTPGN